MGTGKGLHWLVLRLKFAWTREFFCIVRGKGTKPSGPSSKVSPAARRTRWHITFVVLGFRRLALRQKRGRSGS